jgi:hypothetical protein
MVMNSITFDKTRYHQQGEMIKWCAKNIGNGEWVWGSPETWEGLGDRVWVINSSFGYTTFDFKNSEDLVLFTLRWS